MSEVETTHHPHHLEGLFAELVSDPIPPAPAVPPDGYTIKDTREDGTEEKDVD
jgi:hypothetical protein